MIAFLLGGPTDLEIGSHEYLSTYIYSSELSELGAILWGPSRALYYPFDPIKHPGPLDVAGSHLFYAQPIWLDCWIEMQKKIAFLDTP